MSEHIFPGRELFLPTRGRLTIHFEKAGGYALLISRMTTCLQQTALERLRLYTSASYSGLFPLYFTQLYHRYLQQSHHDRLYRSRYIINMPNPAKRAAPAEPGTTSDPRFSSDKMAASAEPDSTPGPRFDDIDNTLNTPTGRAYKRRRVAFPQFLTADGEA